MTPEELEKLKERVRRSEELLRAIDNYSAGVKRLADVVWLGVSFESTSRPIFYRDEGMEKEKSVCWADDSLAIEIKDAIRELLKKRRDKAQEEYDSL